MENKTLIIWLKQGQTLKFEQVTNLKDTADAKLTFSYFGISSNVKRQAVFNLIDIAGFALEV